MRKFLLLTAILISATACSDTNKNDKEEPATGSIDPVAARTASDFINSIGVNTHFGFQNTNYQKWDELLYPRLKELGVKHIRDGYGYSEKAEERFLVIGKEGIKLLLSARLDEPDMIMGKVKRLMPILSGVEGVNEVDLSYDPNRDPAVWVPVARSKQKELYELMKADPETKHLPVVALSLGNIRDNAQLLGDISPWVEFGNIHPYAAGRHPEFHWGYGLTADDIFRHAGIMSGDKPIMATEAGYHNLYNFQSSHPGTPEEVDAVYVLHLLFEYFNKGIARTYLYEFLDQKPDNNTDIEMHFGMIRVDGEPKPSFYALKNLIALLSDSEDSFTPAPLEFELESPNLPSKEKIHYTLLQKKNGSWWIAIYRNAEIYNTEYQTTRKVEPVKAKLKLDRRATNITIYLPNKSQSKESSFTNEHSIEFDLGPELVLIEVIR